MSQSMTGRMVVLDTETTGLSHQMGHRVIEIGAVELINRKLTGKVFHCYLQPDREVDFGAMKVHGITNEFLKDKPRFIEIADDLKRFIGQDELVIHNAPFDIGFLNNEFNLINDTITNLYDLCSVIDTLVLARKMYPGQKNNLDILCKRYKVDNSHREFHGALLDAEILAEVYIRMTGGQAVFALQEEQVESSIIQTQSEIPAQVYEWIQKASDEELAAHATRLAAIEKVHGKPTLWSVLESE